ncbi:MAG: PKD domain-containing protein [Chitinophagaceae bacterium]|nr:PKD domain-containing protein [Chitinophagaceae bacterium]
MATDKNEYRVNENGFTMKLDRNVLFTFLSVLIISIILLAFKFATNVECHLITIKTSTTSSLKHFKDQFFTGEVIQFTAVSKKAKTFEWDYGDGTLSSKSQTTTHAFLKPGNYIIQVKINEKCVEFKEIIVINSPQTTNEMMDALKSDKPFIMGPEVVTAGEVVSFQDASQGSNVWEWTVLNTPDIPAQTGATVNFTFPAPGTKIIQVVTNGDPNRSAQKTITILAKQNNMNSGAGAVAQMPMPTPMPMPSPKTKMIEPQEETEEIVPIETKKEEKAPVRVLPDMEFKNMIESVTNGKIMPEAVNAYLCNGINTKVHKNGDWDTWGNFAREISGKKRVDIKSVKVYRDENNCVTTLEIEYKKRLF